MMTSRDGSVVVSVRDLTTRPADDLIRYIGTSDRVALDLASPATTDVLALTTILVSLAAGQRAIDIKGELGRAGKRQSSFAQTILRSVLWHGPTARVVASSSDLNELPSPLADSESRSFVTPTSLFSCANREEFQRDLAGILRQAGISMLPEVLGRIASVAFEAVSNCEEHG